MAEPQSAPASLATGEQVQEKGLLDQIVEKGRFGVEPASRERGKNLVKEFVAQFLDGSMTIARDAEMMINQRIAQIDHLDSLQLNEIMHHASFQKLEGTWRGGLGGEPASRERGKNLVKEFVAQFLDGSMNCATNS